MENSPPTSECIDPNGFVVPLVMTLMIFCLCLAWMLTMHIEASFVYSWMRDGWAVGWMLAAWQCDSGDSEIVSGFQVAFGNSEAGGHFGMVLAALGEARCREHVVGSVKCNIDRTVVCAFDGALSHILFPLLKVDFIDILGNVDLSVVVGDLMQGSVSRLTVMVLDGAETEHWSHPNANLYPAESNRSMDRWESKNVGL